MRPIPPSLTLLLASIGLFLVAFTARMIFLSDIVPIAAVEEAQSVWALEMAFVLKAIENIAAFGAVLVLVAWVGRRIAQRMRLPSPAAHE